MIKNDISTKIGDLVTKVMLVMIRIYQMTLSRMLGPVCRFYPSCSHYAYEAIDKYGPWRGGWMAAQRLGRCHPFSPGGYDPVD